jgi:hypothetical protein
MAANKSSLSQILKRTNLHHDVTGVARMLKNKIYIGIYEHGDLYIENFCPPIIDRKLFDMVQKIRDQARQRRGYYHPRSVASDRYLLTGLIYCAVCGNVMHGQRYHDWRYYICHNIPSRTVDGTCSSAGILADAIEEATLNQLKEIIETPAILNQLFLEDQQKSGKQNDEHELHLQRKQEDLEQLARQISRVVDAISKMPDSESLLLKLKNLEEEQSKTRQEVAELEANKPVKIRIEDINQLSDQIKDRLENASTITIQQILRSLNTRVTAKRILTKRDSSLFTGSVEFDFGVKIKLDL